MTEPARLREWRREIPLLERAIPMNACSQAPQTRAARSAAERFLESWNREGMDWDAWVGEVERARVAFAALIGADPDEVAVASSVSQATSSLASALDFSGSRRRIVTTAEEFPTVAQVWGAQAPRGAEIVTVGSLEGGVAEGAWEEAIDESARLVSVTHGAYRSGAVSELRAPIRLARDAGALSFVDAYQTLGTTPVDVRALGVDALAAGCLKYLMGIAGIAFLYVRREVAERLTPTVTGWFGRQDPFAFSPEVDWAGGARRFDTGTPPILSAYVAVAGMDTIAEVGPERVRDWTRTLTSRLIERAEARGLVLVGPPDASARTPSTVFRCDDAADVESALRTAGVLTSARGRAIRLAPHYYSSTDDVDRAVDALATELGRRGRT